MSLVLREESKFKTYFCKDSQGVGGVQLCGSSKTILLRQLLAVLILQHFRFKPREKRNNNLKCCPKEWITKLLQSRSLQLWEARKSPQRGIAARAWGTSAKNVSEGIAEWVGGQRLESGIPSDFDMLWSLADGITASKNCPHPKPTCKNLLP